MKTLISFALVSLFIVGAAVADTSALNILGFSKDGAYFSFELYGQEDGIGRYYSNIFFIDVKTDKWAKSPSRFSTEEGSDTGQDLFRSSMQHAASSITELGIIYGNMGEFCPVGGFAGTGAETPGFGDLSGEGQSTDQKQYRFDMGAKTITFRLTEVPVEGLLTTHGGIQVKMMKLEMSDSATGKTTVVAEDKKLPESRSTPIAYDLAGLYRYPVADGEYNLAVLVKYTLPGFEDSVDERFIVIGCSTAQK